MFVLNECHLFSPFVNMEYFADPAELQSCKDSSSHSWHCKEWPECNPPCKVHTFDCFSHCSLAIFLQGFQIYLPLFQMLWVCTSGTGVLGWCPRDTTVSWFIWRYDKMLCSRCDEWGRITFLHFVATMACFFLHRNKSFIKNEVFFTAVPLTDLSCYCVLGCNLPTDCLRIPL